MGTGGIGLAVAMGAWARPQRRLVSLRNLAATLGLIVSVFGLGGARFVTHEAPRPHAVSDQIEASAPSSTLLGWVSAPPVRQPRRLRFAIDVISTHDPLQGRVQITLYARDSITAAHMPPVQWGDTVLVTGRLRPLPERRNPADFDYGLFLKRRGVHALLDLNDPTGIEIQGRRLPWWGTLADPIRQHVRSALRVHLRDEPTRALLQALILGDRSRLDATTRSTFIETGLAHLLAVSGLHVLVVGLVAYGLCKPLLLRLHVSWTVMEWTRAILTSILLLTYMIISGGSASVVRAVLMTVLMIGGHVLQRTSSGLNALGTAAFVLLLFRPTLLFEAGFQLSFTAVAALLLLHPRLYEWPPEAWTRHAPVRVVWGGLSVSVAATLGTLPVLLYHFGQVALAGLLLNLMAIPATSTALLSGLLLVATHGWVPGWADAFGGVTEAATLLLLSITEWGATTMSGLQISGYVRDPMLHLALFTALAALAFGHRPRRRWRLTVVSLVCLSLAVWLSVLRGDARPRLEVVFFDVGHGDAALLRLPNDQTILVDAGRSPVSHFERYGIDRLNAVILSHAHFDHYAGLPDVLRTLPVDRFVFNGHVSDSKLYTALMHTVDSLGLPIHTTVAGDTLDVDPDVRLEMLSPASIPQPEDDPNDASLVLRVAYGNVTFLFMGDAEAQAERFLGARYADRLAADVIKVGHHGSRTSSTPPFVHHVAPDSVSGRLAIVSVSRLGRHGLPDEDVLERWEAAGAVVRSTGEEGAIWLKTDGHTIEGVDWK